MIKVKPHACVEQLIVSDLVVCGASYHTRAAPSYDMRPHKQTQFDTISCSAHPCGFPIVSHYPHVPPILMSPIFMGNLFSCVTYFHVIYFHVSPILMCDLFS